MKNRNVGMLIIGIALILGVIVFLFNSAMTKIVSTSCSHGPSCTMYGEIKTQTYIADAIIGVIVIIGLVFMFTKENEKVVVKRIKPYKESELKPKKFSKESLKDLDSDERSVMNLLLKNKGSIFQSKIVDETGINKVKITRILDGLEAQGLIERKRRGMTNVVVLK